MNLENLIDEAIIGKEAMQGSFSGPINKDASKLKFKNHNYQWRSASAPWALQGQEGVSRKPCLWQGKWEAT